MSRPLISIALLAVSRGRPGMFYESYNAALSLCSHAQNITVALRVDDDESLETIESYRKILRQQDDFVVGPTPKTSIVDHFQELYKKHPMFDVYFCLSDDTICRTPKWDSMILSYMNIVPGDPIIALIETSDGMNWQETQFFWSRGWIECLGFLMPSGLVCCEDTYIAEIGSKLVQRGFGAHYKSAKDIVFEHVHPGFGKRARDATDNYGDERRLAHGDRNAYQEHLSVIPSYVDKLVSCIQAAL